MNGKEYTVFPDIKIGQEKMPERQNTDKEYFAFGSDDLDARKKSDDKTLEERLKSGKEMFSKFGSFISSSVQNIVKPKKNSEDKIEPNLKTSQVQKSLPEPAPQPTKSDTGKKNEKLAELKNISAKIGAGFLSFGV